MSLVLGDMVILEFYNNGEWQPYACARSCTFSSSTSLIETSVTGSGKFKAFTPEVNTFSGNCDGVTSLDNPGFLTLYKLRQFQLGHVLQRCRFRRTAIDGVSTYTDTVNFFITNVSDTSSFDNISTFTVEMQGTGVVDQTIIEPPIIITKVKRYEYTATGNETGFTEHLLINKDILAVHKDGLGNSRIILTGSPASKEVKYLDTTGEFLWAVQFEPNEEAYVLYQDR